MPNAAYDPVAAKNLANRLYAEAEAAVITYTVIGAGFFAIIFYFATTAAVYPFSTFAPNKSLGIGLLLGVVLGFIVGQRKSYRLMLAAQLALCQIQIEINTRPVIAEKEVL
jgi:tetrahydromethanopterin S-methyltransferase subunit C